MRFLKEIESVFDEYNGRQLAVFYTSRIDEFLTKIFNSVESKAPLTLIAVGGYGRSELAPFSDIDIMFFAKDKSDSKKVETVLYQLWDKGLTVGHSFRNAAECLIEAKKDIRTHTSLLESRFIAGDRELYNYFYEKVFSELAYKRQKKFVQEKLSEMSKRHRDFGGSVFLLEPNVKEGQGGLRDIHTILWLSAVALKLRGIDALVSVLSPEEYRKLLKAYDFMLKVRFCLHLLNSRKNDVLSLGVHDAVAERMGFHNSKKFLGSERFMRYFYLKASAIRDITAIVTETATRRIIETRQDLERFKREKVIDEFYVVNNLIVSSVKDIFSRKPEKILEAFYVFSKTGRDFSQQLCKEIRNSLLAVNKKLRSSPNAVNFFRQILRGKRVYETLSRMHETGVLGRFIPEFGALKSLVVYEPYHRYTVDEHTLIAVRNLELLEGTKYPGLKHLSEIMKKINNKELLYLALLFHDIGKAAGKRHQEESYKRLKNIVERFQIDIIQRQRIEFLVRNHILMSTFALRRETEDPEIIAQFADAVSDEESLNAIYLMTYADMSAVNPEFWTEWKAYLLEELYEKTLEYLRGVRKDVGKYKESIIASCGAKERHSIADFLKHMPDRYLLSTTAERVIDDYRLAQIVKKNNFAISIYKRPDKTIELTVGTWDCPGLFSRIVGFLSSKWFNIIRASLYTGENSLVIDKIQISNWNDLWWNGMEAAVEAGLRSVVLDAAPVVLPSVSRDTSVRFEAFVELDNETSEENSIIEFFAADRLRLLYDISDFFHKKGLNIITAKVNTESGIAQDIFYVQDNGQKVEGEKITELVSSLWKILKN